MLISVFVFSFVLTSSAFAEFKTCGTDSGTSDTCINDMSVQDELAKFTHSMRDSFRATDPYHIYFSYVNWTPSVSRGDPVWNNYWIHDSYNGETINTIDDYNGKHLSDYGQVNIATEVTAGYYPNKEPTSTLSIQNAPPVTCQSQYWDCAAYDQSSWFKVNND
jgi:hypothetical protein